MSAPVRSEPCLFNRQRGHDRRGPLGPGTELIAQRCLFIRLFRHEKDLVTLALPRHSVGSQVPADHRPYGHDPHQQGKRRTRKKRDSERKLSERNDRDGSEHRAKPAHCRFPAARR